MAEEKAQLKVLSGVFYDENDTLMVADDTLGAMSVRAALEPLLGRSVVLVAHHCPPDPPDPARWGGGSCLLEGAGHCHAGHHERPGWLYEGKHRGTLVYEATSNEWFTEHEGKRLKIYLDFLVGHRSQIVVSALPSVEDLQGKIKAEMENPTIDGLQARIAEMRDLLTWAKDEKDNL